MTRFAYYWAVGAFNIRKAVDRIQITDEIIDGVAIRIYKPLPLHNPEEAKNSSESSLMPTIIFYHGGGHFIGSVGL